MVIPCSRSAARPSTSSAKSRSPPWVPTFFESASQGRQVVLEDQLRVVEQPADERALAVVDTPAGDETEHRLGVVALQVGIDVGDEEIVGGVRHQKYPSAFLSSMEELESRSMTRPTRSELVVSNISWMMPDSVSALLSMAPVSG